MRGMSHEQLREVLGQLEQAGEDHARWHEAFTRALVCRLPAGPADLDEGSHRLCRFGDWYYERSPAVLRTHAAFLAMESEHRHMHAVATRMLRASAAGAPVAAADFDDYSAARQRLRIELDALRQAVAGLLGSRDPLTGAHRRTDLLVDLREALELARRGIQDSCIAFMDLDRFKAVNDRHGHRVGDEVLGGAIRFVLEHLRPFDRVYRYGGDEFLISMPGTDLATGRQVIERVRVGLARVTLARCASKPIRVTASFGIALLDVYASIEESIDNADRALLAAKATGRNRSCCWDPAATIAASPPVPEPRVLELDLEPPPAAVASGPIRPSRRRRDRLS
jgi:diguanylate cyclase (GGDEF)-like protein